MTNNDNAHNAGDNPFISNDTVDMGTLNARVKAQIATELVQTITLVYEKKLFFP